MQVPAFRPCEPLARKADLIRLREKRGDCAFLAFKNATPIDGVFADGPRASKPNRHGVEASGKTAKQTQ